MTRKGKHVQQGENKARSVIEKRSREKSEQKDGEQLKDYIQLRRRKLRGQIEEVRRDTEKKIKGFSNFMNAKAEAEIQGTLGQ